MKKVKILLFVIITLLLVNISKAQNKTIGIGRLQVSLNHDIPLYDKETGLCIDTMKFSIIKSKKDKGKYTTTTKLPFKPMEYYAGDSEKEADENRGIGLIYFAPHLSFRVLKHSNNEYIVVLNEDTFETAIIKNDTVHKLYTLGKPYWNMSYGSGHYGGNPDESWFLYETWGTYLGRMMYVSTDGCKLYNGINGKKINSEVNSWTVMEVKGNWAKVVERKNSPNLEIAWVQWTDGEKFLIRRVSELYY